MAKIGRNEKCPCQRGKKFKHCCSGSEHRMLPASAPGASLKLTLMNEVKNIQEDAAQKRAKVRELGVFFFFSTEEGDAWVLEMTDRDCIKVAEKGAALAPPIDENPETIEVNWSHTFELRGKNLYLTAYGTTDPVLFANAPTRELNGAMRRIHKRFTEEQLQQVHLPAPPQP